MENTSSGTNRMGVLQKFANPKVYLFLFSLTGILQGIYSTYFIGVLSTLERRYAFDSSITSLILIADNLSPAIFSIFVGYYGKLTHRPRLLTYGLMVTALSCFLCCVPILIFGHSASHLDVQYRTKNVNKTYGIQLCVDNTANDTIEKCDKQELSESNFAVSVLFLANFLTGCGSTIYYTIGTSYLDDNVKKKESPLYLGTFFALRAIGPTLGFMLSSVCLRFYENPFLDPGFSANDHRWIGCWWLGFLILGLTLVVVSFPIALFPKQIVKTETPRTESVALKKMLYDMYISLKKLVRNQILVFHTLSIIFQINGIYLYQMFMPKYMESQFKQTASLASLFSGTTKLFTLIGSIMLGSILIKVFMPTPKYLTGYMTFVALFSTVGVVSAFFFGCSSSNIFGLTNGGFNVHDKCNSGCGCSLEMHDPVCVGDDTLFYSPCFAGCQSYVLHNKTKAFNDCSCIETYYKEDQNVKEGYCPISCNMFLPYFVIMTMSIVLTSTTRVSKVLVTLRCGAESEKSLTLGSVEFCISILATIPSPLIYGRIIDNSCVLWEENCGKRGNCLYYDNDKFRYNFHALSVSFLLCGLLCEVFVFYLSNRLRDFYGQVSGNRQNILKENGAEISFMS